MTQFNPLDHAVDFNWLYANKWTIKSWTAYCHILHEFNQCNYDRSQADRFYQILEQYDLNSEEFNRVIQGLKALAKAKLDLCEIFSRKPAT